MSVKSTSTFSYGVDPFGMQDVKFRMGRKTEKTMDMPFFEWEVKEILSFLHDPIINGEPCTENMWKKYYHGVDPLKLAEKFWGVLNLVGLEIKYYNINPELFEKLFGFKDYRAQEQHHVKLPVNLSQDEYSFLLEILSSERYSKREIIYYTNQNLYSRIHGYANKLDGVKDENTPHRKAMEMVKI